MTASTATDRLLGANEIEEMVLGENGVVFASDSQSVFALSGETLNTLWTYNSGIRGGIESVLATADGGVIINKFGSAVPLDSSGAPGSTYPSGTPWAGSDWIDVVASGTSGATSGLQRMSGDRRAMRRRSGMRSRMQGVSPMNTSAAPAYAMFASLYAVPAFSFWPRPYGNAAENSDSQPVFKIEVRVYELATVPPFASGWATIIKKADDWWRSSTGGVISLSLPQVSTNYSNRYDESYALEDWVPLGDGDHARS